MSTSRVTTAVACLVAVLAMLATSVEAASASTTTTTPVVQVDMTKSFAGASSMTSSTASTGVATPHASTTCDTNVYALPADAKGSKGEWHPLIREAAYQPVCSPKCFAGVLYPQDGQKACNFEVKLDKTRRIKRDCVQGVYGKYVARLCAIKATQNIACTSEAYELDELCAWQGNALTMLIGRFTLTCYIKGDPTARRCASISGRAYERDHGEGGYVPIHCGITGYVRCPAGGIGTGWYGSGWIETDNGLSLTKQHYYLGVFKLGVSAIKVKFGGAYFLFGKGWFSQHVPRVTV